MTTITTYRPGQLEDLCDPGDAHPGDLIIVAYDAIERPLTAADILRVLAGTGRVGPTATLILISLYQQRPAGLGPIAVTGITLGQIAEQIGVKPRMLVRCLYRLHYFGGYDIEVRNGFDGSHTMIIGLPDLTR